MAPPEVLASTVVVPLLVKSPLMVTPTNGLTVTVPEDTTVPVSDSGAVLELLVARPFWSKVMAPLEVKVVPDATTSPGGPPPQVPVRVSSMVPALVTFPEVVAVAGWEPPQVSLPITWKVCPATTDPSRVAESLGCSA